ncbi:hypothetical protein BTN49_0391 [Candidatus Enterovibrio escicola]|uniref:Uncharacterized protein n=1 Tax=Candidatus Enterovibrio escicola TaxID=1927127 RepID=A0A2A5T5M2_9GAMM|nr:hypothetical protein BTN49_0391 [Candidatus Enterovibrio escacola]
MVERFIDIVDSTFHDLKTFTSDNGTKVSDHEEVTETI